jgi:uncharacterized protein YkwD
MEDMVRRMAGACALALLAGCGGSEGGAGGGTPVAVVGVTPTPTPSPTPSATPTPLPTPTATSTPAPPVPPAPTVPSSWAAGSAALYDAAPDVPGCRTGTLKASVKADVLARLNAVRAIHRLSPVTYASGDDEQAAQSSLMMAANGQLTHTPPASWLCYTAAGAAGAGSGNLYGGTVSPYLRWYSEDDYIAGWLTEVASASIGHRRWMLDPFLGRISYGRVSQLLSDGRRTDSATMKVFGFSAGTPAPASVPPFVAYPYGDYPERYMDPAALLSFSVVAGTSGRGASAGVRLAGAQISVSAGATALAVSEVRADNDGYGLPNSIQWKVAGLRPNVTYTVRITGVTGAPQADYQYDFRLVP